MQRTLSCAHGTSFRHTRLPRYAIAVLEALQVSDANFDLLSCLEDREWEELLAFCDAAQLTLILGFVCRPCLPDWVRRRIDRNYSDNAERCRQLEAALVEVADRFRPESIDFVLLKGATHSPDFTPDPLLRATGDIDLWCLLQSVPRAQDQLLALGYQPVAASKGRHLAPMARLTNWQWRGDFFATDLPLPIDLHYTLWDEEFEHMPALPEQEFWSRRQPVLLHDRVLSVLSRPDALAFAALHLLMHILHGDLRLQRAWEIGHFLHTRGCDETFWLEWQRLHPPDLRKLETLIFVLAAKWFSCELPETLEQEAQTLPDELKLWIQQYSLSPIESLFAPNKHELWLNLCLVESFRNKLRVFLRRVLPLQALPAAHVPNARTGDAAERARMRRRFWSRAAHHTRTLPGTVFGGLKWWWIRQGFSREFLKFLLSSALFDFGEFVFFLLYNLYLLDQGYNEKFLGQLAGAMTAGTFVGILPASALLRRIGLRNGLMVAILGDAAATSLRALVLNPAPLLISAALNGLFMSLWAIAFPPTIAGFTSERNRPFAFSLVTSLGIGIGVLSGLLGGHLPALLLSALPLATSAASKRGALLLGSAIAALAVIPIARSKFPHTDRAKKRAKVYPRSRFIVTFLSALFVWNIGIGAFNPFFNVYFSRRFHMNAEGIGIVFSYAQLAQVAAILSAPFFLRKFGEMRGIAGMLIATALMLAGLGVSVNPFTASLIYIAYMCFQSMSEPGLFTVLMNRVDPTEQSGASAMNFLVTSLAGILAATVAGAMFARWGYSFVLPIAAFLSLAAALMFYKLVPPRVNAVKNLAEEEGFEPPNEFPR